MGLCNSSDIFQEKMNELFNGVEYIRAYIDDLIINSNGNFENAAGIKINEEKFVFANKYLYQLIKGNLEAV